MSNESLDDVMAMALETGSLYVGSEIYEMFNSLPCNHSIRFFTDSGKVQIVLDNNLEPKSLLAKARGE